MKATRIRLQSIIKQKTIVYYERKNNIALLLTFFTLGVIAYIFGVYVKISNKNAGSWWSFRKKFGKFHIRSAVEEI